MIKEQSYTYETDFYMENPHTNHGDKKPQGLRSLI